jgi:hypothetical protein
MLTKLYAIYQDLSLAKDMKITEFACYFDITLLKERNQCANFFIKLGASSDVDLSIHASFASFYCLTL